MPKEFQRSAYLISKNVIIIAAIIIIGLAAYWLVSLKTMSPPSESFAGVPSSQNPYVQEFSLPSGSAPNGLIVDKNGTVWVASSSFNSLYSFDPMTQQLQSYDIKTGNGLSTVSGQNTTMVWAILQDKDGYIWFSPLGTKSIWRFDSIHGTFDKFQSDTGAAFQMKSDSDGNIWFTTLSGNTLGILQKDTAFPSGYKLESFNLDNDTAPAGLFLKDNFIWVAEITSQKIVQYTIDSHNGIIGNITKIAEFPTDNETLLSSPTDLFVDGNTVWLTEHGTSFLTEYDLHSGTVTRYPTSQNLFHATTLPFWIRGINDGRGLWFNEHEGNKLAYFDTVNKTMTEYNIPSRPKDGYLTYPLNISTDPRDENILWFSEWNTDKIGKINASVKIPFSISADTPQVLLSNDASKETVVNINVGGQSPYSANSVFLNASSSLAPAAGFGDLDVKISPSVLDLSTEHQSQLILRNYSAPPGNYTLGISVSDGLVVKTIFLNLVVPQG